MRRAAWYVWLMLLAGSSYGFVSPLMKMAYAAGLSPAAVTDGQYVAAAVMLWAFVLIRRPSLRLLRKQWLLLVAIGITGAGTSYAYYKSLTLLPASLAIVLLFQFSWIVLVYDILYSRQWPSVQKWFGLGLIMVGTVLAVGLQGESLGKVSGWALLLGLLSACCYASTLFLSGFVHPETSPFVRSAATVGIAAVSILVLFPPAELLSIHVWQRLWPWAVLTALCSQVVPSTLMLVAIPHIGGRMAAVLGSIELPVAVLAAWILLGEHVSTARWLGVALIVAGIVVSEWNVRWITKKFYEKVV